MNNSWDLNNDLFRSEHPHPKGKFKKKKARPKSLQIESWEKWYGEGRILFSSFHEHRNQLPLFDLSPVEKEASDICIPGPFHFDAGPNLGNQKTPENKGANSFPSDNIWNKTQFSIKHGSQVDSQNVPQSGARPKNTSVLRCKNRRRLLSCSDITGTLQI